MTSARLRAVWVAAVLVAGLALAACHQAAAPNSTHATGNGGRPMHGTNANASANSATHASGASVPCGANGTDDPDSAALRLFHFEYVGNLAMAELRAFELDLQHGRARALIEVATAPELSLPSQVDGVQASLGAKPWFDLAEADVERATRAMRSWLQAGPPDAYRVPEFEGVTHTGRIDVVDGAARRSITIEKGPGDWRLAPVSQAWLDVWDVVAAACVPLRCERPVELSYYQWHGSSPGAGYFATTINAYELDLAQRRYRHIDVEARAPDPMLPSDDTSALQRLREADWRGLSALELARIDRMLHAWLATDPPDRYGIDLPIGSREDASAAGITVRAGNEAERVIACHRFGADDPDIAPPQWNQFHALLSTIGAQSGLGWRAEAAR